MGIRLRITTDNRIAIQRQHTCFHYLIILCFSSWDVCFVFVNLIHLLLNKCFFLLVQSMTYDYICPSVVYHLYTYIHDWMLISIMVLQVCHRCKILASIYSFSPFLSLNKASQGCCLTQNCPFRIMFTLAYTCSTTPIPSKYCQKSTLLNMHEWLAALR